MTLQYYKNVWVVISWIFVYLTGNFFDFFVSLRPVLWHVACCHFLNHLSFRNGILLLNLQQVMLHVDSGKICHFFEKWHNVCKSKWFCRFAITFYEFLCTMALTHLNGIISRLMPFYTLLAVSVKIGIKCQSWHVWRSLPVENWKISH